MRPPEWIKNLLVFAGLLFSQKLNEGPQVVDATITFVAFCAISSAGYLVQRPARRRRSTAAIPRSATARSPAASCRRGAAVVAAAVALAVGRDWRSRSLAVSAEVAGLVAALRRDHRRLLADRSSAS